MDNTIDHLEHLENELKKAQLELAEVEKEVARQIADAEAAAKAELTQAVARAYADGMKKALAELEQPLQKQRKALAAAEAAAQKAAKIPVVKKAATTKKPAVAKKAAAPKKPTAVKKAESAGNKDGAANKPVAPSGSLHEKRLGILEREFNPALKSAHRNAELENATVKDFASLDDILNKSDWS